MKRGLFIVLEGLDRSGKSTQCRRLVEWLKQEGHSVRFQPYPDRSEPETGPKINEFLKNARSPYEQALYIHGLFSENRRILDSKLRRDLEAGMTVIADRYSFSGVAYSAAKHDEELPVVDALQPIDEVFEAVRRLVQKKQEAGVDALRGFQRTDFNLSDA
ncbi:DTMP kinase [Aphelenchoides fujianensis]|nr:DTMP kinase [Aphelenchoides fujianensis]